MEEENKAKRFVNYIDRKFTEKKDDLMDLVQDHFYLFLIFGAIIIGFILILLFFRRKRKDKEDEDDEAESYRKYRNWKMDKGRMIFDERIDEGEER
jgi:LPXTG-motif cell wall-anchored protein